jgi:hypothetical protein
VEMSSAFSIMSIDKSLWGNFGKKRSNVVES